MIRSVPSPSIQSILLSGVTPRQRHAIQPSFQQSSRSSVRFAAEDDKVSLGKPQAPQSAKAASLTATPSVTMPGLHHGVASLMVQATSGFPVAMMRAKLIKAGSPNALMPYDALRQTIDLKSANPNQLIQDVVDTESTAYLTAHLLTLETLLQTPDQKIVIPKTEAQTIRLGVEDAKAVVAHRINQHLYGKEKTLINNQQYKLILHSPKVNLHEHYRGCAPIAMVRSRFIEDQHPEAYLRYDELQDFCRTDRLYTEDGEGPLYERDLNRYRWKNDNLVSPAIHSDDTAYLAAYIYTLRLGLENVRYFEYRLNPISSAVKDPLRYAKAIEQGLDDAKAFLKTRGRNIDANLIFSADRQPKPGVTVQNPHNKPYDPRVLLALEVLDTAIQARKAGMRVTGFDIQGDEAGYAVTDFKPVADALKEWNRTALAKFQSGEWQEDLRIGATIHAGETPQSGLISHPDKPLSGSESIAAAIDLFYDEITINEKLTARALDLFKNTAPSLYANNTVQKAVETIICSMATLIAKGAQWINGSNTYQVLTPVRLGHAIQIMNDPKLVALCRQKQIGLEQCPKSNVQTGAISYYDALPTLTLSRDYGVPASISCDNRTTSKTNACNELVKLTRHLGMRHADRKRLQMDGMNTAFIFNAAQKAAITKEMADAYKQLESEPKYQRIIQQEQDPQGFQTLINNSKG